MISKTIDALYQKMLLFDLYNQSCDRRVFFTILSTKILQKIISPQFPSRNLPRRLIFKNSDRQNCKNIAAHGNPA